MSFGEREPDRGNFLRKSQCNPLVVLLSRRSSEPLGLNLRTDATPEIRFVTSAQPQCKLTRICAGDVGRAGVDEAVQVGQKIRGLSPGQRPRGEDAFPRRSQGKIILKSHIEMMIKTVVIECGPPDLRLLDRATFREWFRVGDRQFDVYVRGRASLKNKPGQNEQRD